MKKSQAYFLVPWFLLWCTGIGVAYAFAPPGPETWPIPKNLMPIAFLEGSTKVLTLGRGYLQSIPRVFSWPSGQLLLEVGGGVREILAYGLPPDGQVLRVLHRTADHKLVFEEIDLNSGTCRIPKQVPARQVWKAELSANGVAGTVTLGTTVGDTKTNYLVQWTPEAVRLTPCAEIYGLAIDGSCVLAADRDGKPRSMCVVEVATGKVLRHAQWPTNQSFDPPIEVAPGGSAWRSPMGGLFFEGQRAVISGQRLDHLGRVDWIEPGQVRGVLAGGPNDVSLFVADLLAGEFRSRIKLKELHLDSNLPSYLGGRRLPNGDDLCFLSSTRGPDAKNWLAAFLKWLQWQGSPDRWTQQVHVVQCRGEQIARIQEVPGRFQLASPDGRWFITRGANNEPLLWSVSLPRDLGTVMYYVLAWTLISVLLPLLGYLLLRRLSAPRTGSAASSGPGGTAPSPAVR